jgi:UDP-N-acetyl-D-glucosamine dehydrogenase
LPLVLLLSEQKFKVTGFDIEKSKVDTVTRGGSYIVRIPGTEIQSAQRAGFTATSDYSRIAEMDAVLIAVPTPLNDHPEPDLSYIVATAEAIARHLRPGQLVVLESTTYPGTTEELLVPILQKNPRRLKAAWRQQRRTDVLCSFLAGARRSGQRYGRARRHSESCGGFNPAATELGCKPYGTIFRRTVPVSAPAVSEMTKLLENMYRCVNIGLVNELKLLCLRMGINIWDVIQAASTKPFGFQPFYLGPGIGGRCIPLYPFYLSWKAKEYDFHTRFIELAGEVNLSMPHVVASTMEALNRQRKSLNGSKVLVLGVAYKKDIDDLR